MGFRGSLIAAFLMFGGLLPLLASCQQPAKPAEAQAPDKNHADADHGHDDSGGGGPY